MRYLILSIGLLGLFSCADAPGAVVQPATTQVSQKSLETDTIAPLPPPPGPIRDIESAKEIPVLENPQIESGQIIRQQNSSIAPTPNTDQGARPRSEIPAGFSDVQDLDPSIRIDIKYATTDNFTHAQIYDCGRCLLRTEAAEALVKVHKSLKKRGLGLKMFDCYRPRPYQQRLWDKVPNPDYVTPPAKGSMHSRGAAVDLILVDAQGNELEMGTPYDFFGKEAHTDYLQHPKKVLNNRNTLKEAMLEQGFKGIRTEWWHFSYQKRSFPLSSELWPCR